MLGSGGKTMSASAIEAEGRDGLSLPGDRQMFMSALPCRHHEGGTVAAMMRSHLDKVRPHTDAEALRILRQDFPAAPLAARVAAMALRAR